MWVNTLMNVEKKSKLGSSAPIGETDLLQHLIEVYKSHGCGSREAVEKAEAELKERRAADELKERRELADFELKKLALQNQQWG
jgi:hypothetical protein